MSIIKKYHYKGIVVLALICAISACNLDGSATVVKPAMQQWEYKVVLFDRDESSSMQTALDVLGGEGWEYAGALANNGINAQYVAFKRPKK